MTFITTNTEKQYKNQFKKRVSKTCSKKLLKKRLPILEWLPKYQAAFLIQDLIAGITVGLTAIPQGIAHAVIAGLPPEHGLYASLTSGIVYIFFGSCSNVTVGPTAILSALTARYIGSYSVDFAIFAAFFTGVLMLAMGILNLGFLVDFISTPVINGFTIAGAMQIISSQLKFLFGLSGSSGSYFAESVQRFFINITTMKLWDSIVGVGTMILLLLLQRLGQGCSRTDSGVLKQIRWFFSLSRNAVVVIVGMVITYTLKITLNAEPVIIIGDIGEGLPKFSWPPFSTSVGNETYSFSDMLAVLGPQAIALPLVATLESIAIAKAFSEGNIVDVTQEMIALGLCNIIGSFGQSMPITGSFTRTALNHVSGVKTSAGGIVEVCLVVVALSYLTSAFYYIPKATLAGLIIYAMVTMIDYGFIIKVWRNSKREFFVLLLTMIVSLLSGLEFGILTGIILEAIFLLYEVARPPVDFKVIRCEKVDLIVIPLSNNVSYCAAEHVRKSVIRASKHTLTKSLIILDGTSLRNMDFTVASNLTSLVKELEKKSRQIILLNFNLNLKNLCVDIDPNSETKFMYAADAIELIHSMTNNV